jgi:2-oxoglutarate dehydrogenase E1 component
MPSHQDSYLSGANIDFIEGLYARFLEDPAGVDASWRSLFQSLKPDGRPITMNGGNGHAAPPPPRQETRLSPQAEIAAVRQMELQARVARAVYAFRLRGHLAAQLDPLERPRPPLEHVADLSLVRDSQFTEEELDSWVDPNDAFEAPRVRLRELLARLRRTYCEHVGVEFMQIADSHRRRWLQPLMELSENRTPFSSAEQRRILEKLSGAEAIESFLHTKYVGAKRFSLEGGESLVAMLDTFLETAGPLGVKEVVIGMAHRGRLNVLTNVLGKSPAELFSEFEGPDDPRAYLDRGDVKYHQGFSSDCVTSSGAKIHLSLAFNPSHLEVVDPVVEGRVRAKQDRAGDAERTQCVPILIHGDAAIAGQGVVAETLNLSELPGYTTGGTVHIVINNQIGFTTDPGETRSSPYCTAVAQMLDIPVFHVNGDDPEACCHVIKLATHFRQQFKTDVVIDLVCYRRYGHNEGDEPAFTQPQMYERIRQHRTVRDLYGEALVKAGRTAPDEVEAIRDRPLKELHEAHARVQAGNLFKEPSFLQGLWQNYRGGPDRDTPDPDTGVDSTRLETLLQKLAAVPEGFAPHPKIARILDARRGMAARQLPIDWAAGEALGFATLLTDGYSLRLTGQDSQRGTFSHRHAVLHDVKSGGTWVPLAHLSDAQGDCTLLNSPLSEVGCLGFELGYSLDYPDALVAWEAQFGDFANGAQVIIDQFIAAAEDKWRRLSSLVMLLPHGYEGQGPEHSSARLERFLQLASEDNIQICYPSTPAQIFHLLRRQVIRPLRKPLVVMSPKSMLRRPEVISTLEDLTHGRFKRLIWDRLEVDREEVDRLLLCTGKIFYDLVAARDALTDLRIGIARVEQLYPFPTEELSHLLDSLPRVREILWVQEEPKNMGAWGYIFPRLGRLAAAREPLPIVGFVGRRDSASPATGFHEAHVLEQKQIVDQATSRGNAHGG